MPRLCPQPPPYTVRLPAVPSAFTATSSELGLLSTKLAAMVLVPHARGVPAVFVRPMVWRRLSHPRISTTPVISVTRARIARWAAPLDDLHVGNRTSARAADQRRVAGGEPALQDRGRQRELPS